MVTVFRSGWNTSNDKCVSDTLVIISSVVERPVRIAAEKPFLLFQTVTRFFNHFTVVFEHYQYGGTRKVVYLLDLLSEVR